MAANNISLTIRIPHELNSQLATVSKDIGVTKTNLIRATIHDTLTIDNLELNFSFPYTDKKDRMVLNVNQLTHNILESICKKYNQSMNSVVIAICVLALERSTKWLQSIVK